MGDHDRQHLFRYLQGALSEEERKRVETHLDTCGECSDFLSFVRKFNATLKEMAGHELLPDTVCPDPETLAAFKAEELDEKAAQKVRVHTAFCKDCLDELYLLRQVDERSKLLKAEDTTPESLSVVAYKHSVCVLALYREVRNPDAQAAEDDDRLVRAKVSELVGLLARSQIDAVVKYLDESTGMRGYHQVPIELPRARVYVVIDTFTSGFGIHSLLSDIEEGHPDAKTIVIGKRCADASDAVSLLHFGVKGLLTYDESREQLIHAISLVAIGGFWISHSILSPAVDSALKTDAVANLSHREQEVLRSLLENLSDKEIASKLDIAEHTVKSHVSKLLSRFGVHDRTDLIVLAFQHRLAQR